MTQVNRENIKDSTRALHALAKLMPKLSSQQTLTDLLQTINHTFGAQTSWVMVEDDAGQQQVVSVGELTCHSSEIKAFLSSALLQRHHRAWRVICWKEKTGTLLFPAMHPGHRQLQCGVLYKLSLQRLLLPRLCATAKQHHRAETGGGDPGRKTEGLFDRPRCP